MAFKGFKNGFDFTNPNASNEENNEVTEVNEEETEETGDNQRGQTVHLKVFAPKKFEEARDIADCLFNDCVVIVNFEHTDKHASRRILDYLMGAVYMLDGDLKPAGSTTFIISPQFVDIDNGFDPQDIANAKAALEEENDSPNPNGGFSSL